MTSRATTVLVIGVAVAMAALFAWPDRPPEPLPAATPEVAALLADLQSEDWPRVRAAAFALECLQERAVPGLLHLVDDPRRAPLVRADRVRRPGHPEGTGPWIPYDLDRISARAGWVLEKITFQSFGFAESRESPAGAAARAREWWQGRRGWTRLDGLLEALDSGDESRQIRAVLFLTAGDTPCSGLDEESYRQRVEPALAPLAARAAAGEVRDADLAALALSLRPAEPARLTVRGVRPGLSLEEARRALGAGPPQTVQYRGEPWLRFDEVRLQASPAGAVERVSGDRLERDGREVARAGQPRDQILRALGPPWFDSGGSRRGSLGYRFEPFHLTVRFREGRASSFRLEPARPPRRPPWEHPRAERDGRRHQRDRHARTEQGDPRKGTT